MPTEADRRSIKLHADGNSFYVSCEMSENPSLRGKAVVVGGDEEARHGIVLAKSDLAKKAGIHTAQVLAKARKLCPNLIVLKPNYALYAQMSDEMRAIFGRYSGNVEPFGLDEAWIGLGRETYGTGKQVADELRAVVKRELGITLSVGVADSKIFAKLGSDMQKPDATTVLRPEDYARRVWPLPVGDLLGVGHSTLDKLTKLGILTIGDLAQVDVRILKKPLGIVGEMLWAYANGRDQSPVAKVGKAAPEKSIGHSRTTPRDLINMEDVKLAFFTLAEPVAERLRAQGFRARTVQISVRDNALSFLNRQIGLKRPTNLAHELVDAAMSLFARSYDFAVDRPVRLVGLRGTNLEPTNGVIQQSLLRDDQKRAKLEFFESAVDGIRKKYGHFAIQRAVLMEDEMGRENPGDHLNQFGSYYMA